MTVVLEVESDVFLQLRCAGAGGDGERLRQRPRPCGRGESTPPAALFNIIGKCMYGNIPPFLRAT